MPDWVKCSKEHSMAAAAKENQKDAEDAEKSVIVLRQLSFFHWRHHATPLFVSKVMRRV
jgi:hypothetical protein